MYITLFSTRHEASRLSRFMPITLVGPIPGAIAASSPFAAMLPNRRLSIVAICAAAGPLAGAAYRCLTR